MKIVLSQPALNRYKWEVETAIASIRALTDTPIVLLFMQYDQSVIDYFTGLNDIEVHAYPDDRPDTTYPANTRPWLMYKYLSEDPSREKEFYFQIDSDVIFREWPDFKHMKSITTLYGSDCGGYIDYDYLITRKQGSDIISNFATRLGVSSSLIRETPGAGAQWAYFGPKAEMWHEIYEKSNELWHYLEYVDSDIQKWTAEMWAQLYIFAKHGYEVVIDKELDFCRPTDDIKMWDMVKILHNAGVVEEGAAGLLYKGKYVEDSPFNEDLSWVRRDRAGWHYARAVDKAAGKL